MRPATLASPMTVRRPDPGQGLTHPLWSAEGWPDPDLDVLRTELARGNFAWVEDFFQSNPDPEVRMFYLDAIQKGADSNGWVDAWLARSPESAIARLVCGVWAVGWAWKARGAGPSSDLTQDARTQFAERLQTADRWLAQAAAFDPKDPVPWAYLLTTARGLGLGPADWDVRYQAGRQIAPLWRFEQQRHVHLCAKWGGSHAQMFEHARASSAAPVGDVTHTLVALAHVERWMFASMNREADADGWWARPEVKDEVVAAAKRSVLSPDWRYDDRLRVAELNAWALALFLVNERESARTILDRLAGVWTEYPWSYLGDPKLAYQRARVAAPPPPPGPRPQGPRPKPIPRDPPPPDETGNTILRVLGASLAAVLVLSLLIVGGSALLSFGMCGGCLGLIAVVPPTTDSVAEARAEELAKIPVDTRYDRLEKLMVQIEDDARDNKITIMQWSDIHDDIKAATRDGQLDEAEISRIERNYARR